MALFQYTPLITRTQAASLVKKVIFSMNGIRFVYSQKLVVFEKCVFGVQGATSGFSSLF